MSGSKVIVVIRAAEERTLESCKQLVGKQLPGESINVVNERPFEAALRRCYQIGIDSKAEWMLTLDADVLLRNGALEALLAEAQKTPDHYFQIEGLVHDKLTGLYRNAGHRMYRTRYLPAALENIPPDGAEIRPESATLLRMASLGFSSKQLQLVCGIHDYEQRYEDIYRKAFVHANKHPEWIGMLVQRWKQRADRDPDFQVALRGLCDGLVTCAQVMIDARCYKAGAADALESLGIQEKAPLPGEWACFESVQAILEEAGPLPMSHCEPLRLSCKEKFKQHLSRVGFLKFAPYLVGAFLSKVGAWMIEKVERQ